MISEGAREGFLQPKVPKDATDCSLLYTEDLGGEFEAIGIFFVRVRDGWWCSEVGEVARETK